MREKEGRGKAGTHPDWATVHHCLITWLDGTSMMKYHDHAFELFDRYTSQYVNSVQYHERVEWSYPWEGSLYVRPEPYPFGPGSVLYVSTQSWQESVQSYHSH